MNPLISDLLSHFEGVKRCGEGFMARCPAHDDGAASRNGSESLLAEVRTGTATDALWHGLGSNRANGVRLSPGDKRRAVELALDRFPAKSQQEIADHVGCAQSYVAAVKRDVITSDNVSTRKDTKGRNQPTAKIDRAIRNGWRPGRGPVGTFARKRRTPAGRGI